MLKKQVSPKIYLKAFDTVVLWYDGIGCGRGAVPLRRCRCEAQQLDTQTPSSSHLGVWDAGASQGVQAVNLHHRLRQGRCIPSRVGRGPRRLRGWAVAWRLEGGSCGRPLPFCAPWTAALTRLRICAEGSWGSQEGSGSVLRTPWS